MFPFYLSPLLKAPKVERFFVVFRGLAKIKALVRIPIITIANNNVGNVGKESYELYFLAVLRLFIS